MRFSRNSPIYLFALGLMLGVLGEGMLFMHAHCLKVEGILLEDFRLIVFLDGDVGARRRKVVEERVLALPGTASVRHVSPEESLAEIESADPGIAESVAVLGDNPLPDAFEVTIETERLNAMEAWLKSAAAIPEVADIRYKGLQVRMIRQVQFYSRFLALVLASGACALGLGLALLAASTLMSGGSFTDLFGSPATAAVRAAAAAAGTLAGISVALGFAYPAAQEGFLQAWPSAGMQALLALAGALLGALFQPPGGNRTPLKSRGSSGRPVYRAAATVIVCGLIVGAAPARAANLRAKRSELKKVKKELQRTRSEVERYHREEKKLWTNLRKSQGEERRTQGTLRRLRMKKRKSRRDAERLSSRLAALDMARAGGRSALSREVSALARGTAGESELFGLAGVWKSAFRRAAIRDKTVYLARLRRFHGETALKHEAAASRTGVLSRRADRTLTKLEETRKRKLRVKEVFEDVKAKGSAADRRLRELEENARALAGLITRLQKKGRRGAKSYPYEPPVSRHSLNWPVRGEIASRYGKKRVPELGTWTIHNGIEIRTPAGAEVKAVASGKVIFTGPFRSYGKVVIVDHGKGFFSIYGKLDEILSKKGDRVRSGTGIAAVAKGRGSLMYLELRQGTRALNPIAWLKKP